jgi:hypothetical protein
MKKLLLASALALALGGCVSAPIKTLDSASELQGKIIVVTNYATPGFAAMTAGKAMFGMLGGAAMVMAGNDLVKKDQIPDTSIAVAAKVAQDLEKSHGDTLLPNSGVVATDDNATALVKEYPGADLIVDVKTIGWMSAYFPSDWGKYHVIYNARMRVLNGHTGQLVAQSICKSSWPDKGHAPTKDQLLAHHGQLLKSLLQKAGDSCVNLFEKQILKV